MSLPNDRRIAVQSRSFSGRRRAVLRRDLEAALVSNQLAVDKDAIALRSEPREEKGTVLLDPDRVAVEAGSHALDNVKPICARGSMALWRDTTLEPTRSRAPP